MQHSHEHSTARSWRSRICLLAALVASVAALTAAVSAPSALADCTTGGSGCLPGSGYTFESNWNCGAINAAACYYNGTTSSGSATPQHYGWGSAAYNGAGTVFVCMYGGGYFLSCANNLARGCFAANCNDQDAVSFLMWVENHSGVAHTILGHSWS